MQASGHVDGDTGGAGRRQSGRAPNDALFARNAYGGLQTPYGEVKLGRVLNPVFLATAQTDFIPGGADGADGAGSGHARPVAASQLFRRWQLPLRRLERLRCVQRCVGCAAARERQDRPARRVGGGRQRQYPGVVGPHQERQRRRAGQPDSRRDTGAFGYNYSTSPRTELYAVLQLDRLSTANRARTCALGMRHQF